MLAATKKSKAIRQQKAAGTDEQAVRSDDILARRQRENRFVGATEDETDQRVEDYNRFLETLSDEDMDRELAKLSSDELHVLAWITTYYQHNKRRKGRKK